MAAVEEARQADKEGMEQLCLVKLASVFVKQQRAREAITALKAILDDRVDGLSGALYRIAEWDYPDKLKYTADEDLEVIEEAARRYHALTKGGDSA